MKKFIAIVIASVFITASGFAQKGNNKIGVGADLSFPTGDFGEAFKTGFGGYVKGMYGIGEAGQITFTTGYSGFKLKNSIDDFKMTTSIIPLLAGYRHNFQSFFAEPQIGYGIYGIKVETDIEGLEGKESEGAFTWALNAGYVFNDKIEVSARYQSGHKDGSSQSLFGLRVGYNFSLGSK
jgi:hypothetical protein